MAQFQYHQMSHEPTVWFAPYELGEANWFSLWSLQGLSNAVENGGQLGSTTDERLASLNLENVSPKEGVGGSSPSGAASATQHGSFCVSGFNHRGVKTSR